jgi:hypothetical protein
MDRQKMYEMDRQKIGYWILDRQKMYRDGKTENVHRWIDRKWTKLDRPKTNKAADTENVQCIDRKYTDAQVQ